MFQTAGPDHFIGKVRAAKAIRPKGIPPPAMRAVQAAAACCRRRCGRNGTMPPGFFDPANPNQNSPVKKPADFFTGLFLLIVGHITAPRKRARTNHLVIWKERVMGAAW